MEKLMVHIEVHLLITGFDQPFLLFVTWGVVDILGADQRLREAELADQTTRHFECSVIFLGVH